jgi:hypothetical protein
MDDVDEAFRLQWGKWVSVDGQQSPVFAGWNPTFFTATDANRQKWVQYADAVKAALIALGKRSTRGFHISAELQGRFRRLFMPRAGPQHSHQALATNPQFARHLLPIICPSFLLYCDSLLENSQYALQEVGRLAVHAGDRS